MKKIFRYFLVLTSLISVISCTQREDVDFQDIKVDMLFSAYMADDSITKTVIDGDVGDEYRKTLWLPGDSVGITTGAGKPVEKFVNTQTSVSELALLEGSISSTGSYYAIYPYSTSLKMESTSFVFNIPSVQKYQPNSFSPDAAPMVAKLEGEGEGQSLYFKNLCGVLIINLTGEEKVKTITFSGKDESGETIKVSGKWSVDMSYSNLPEIAPTDSALASVTLQCEEGVQLDPTTPTPFYIVLPPATYHSFSVMVTTSDGSFMFKEATKPLTIKRANVTSASSLIYAQSVGLNLNIHGVANTYIVSETGVYSFDASTIGNGAEGIIQGAGFHAESAEIVPTSAELLWSEPSSLLSNITYNSEAKSISFLYMGEEGNAVIAAKDAEGTILWSWHIWCTDEPKEQEYINSAGTFYVLDRNIGATRGDKGTGDEWQESMGTLYFWGRKDPFNGKNHVSFGKETLTIEETIHFPMHTHNVSHWTTSISSWMKNYIKLAWSENVKTIYDPCPVGYKVATTAIWKDFTTTSMSSEKLDELNVDGVYDNGWYFYIDENKTKKAWYPVSHSFSWNGNYVNINAKDHKVWSSDLSDNTQRYALQYVYMSDYDVKVDPAAQEFDGYAHPVRCVRYEGFIDLALPTVSLVEIKSVTKNSATVVANVSEEGASQVTERGIIVGATPDISLDKGTKYELGSGIGEFSLDLTDLTSLTKYYVKVYATNADGTSYSQVQSFITDYEGEEINLSAAGTANSYIVPDNGRDFIFDAGVKGNTSTLVGEIASAEVLWEAKSTYVPVAKGDIISSVSLLDNGYIRFSIAKEFTPGNAVIAVKDADGVILWSWHIWITDRPIEHQYVNSLGTFYVMDRNMGATRGDRGTGEQWKESCGIEYQWGRKDPFSGGNFTETTQSFTIEESIKNPTVKSGWDRVAGLWSTTQKTMYDPCPVGYRVAPYDIWSDFSLQTTSGSFQNGWHFVYDDQGNTSWYPNRGYQKPNGIDYWGDNYMLSSSGTGEGIYFSNSDIRKIDNDYGHIRCMKDGDTDVVMEPSVIINDVRDVGVSSAVIEAEIIRDGRSVITEKGVIWGEVSGLSINNAPNKVASDDTGKVFEAELSGLTDATKYYVRAYAKNSAGVGYSEEVSFTTLYSGEEKDLSSNGTANSYIVNKYGIYSFDATVKGNSTTKVEGTPVSAEVLWETRNTSESITVGCVITDVTFENGRVRFTTSEDVTPGNALIAVKDADGIILWSWHIWVVDYNPKALNEEYPSGAVVMDRDLGALSNGTDIQANGLLYQWGRKDPFMGVGGNNVPAVTAPAKAVKYEKTSAAKGTLAYVETIPQVMLYNDANWKDWLYTYNNTLWSEEKTLYDPCPSGWKVPSYEDHIWDGLSGVTYLISGYAVDGTNADFGTDHWTSTARTDDNGRVFTKRGNNRGKVSPARVRCIRESELKIEEVASVAKSSGASVTAAVTSGTLSSIEEYGVVISDANNQKLVITNENIMVIKGDSSYTGLGELNVNIEDLSPNTRYFYRVYVIGDNGIEYSQVNTFDTKSSGHNENVGDEDYEW